jgi:hypothetical protein
MATMPFHGAGRLGKSKTLNSPGESGMAKIRAWFFHCSLSWMLSSLKTFIMLG